MAVVYFIKNKINGKLYVGSAVNFHNRKMRHLRCLREGKHHSIHLQRAWDKYGEDSFEFGIIEDNIPREKMYEREQYYLDKYQPFGEGGYNMSHNARGVCLPGDENPMYGKFGKDHPAYGRVVTDAEKKRHHDSMIGKKHNMTEEGRKKLFECAKSRKGYRNGIYGKHLSSEAKEKLSNNRSIPIIQYDVETGDSLGRWSSSKNAMQKLQISNSSIIKCCKRKVKTAGKSIWRYANETYCNGSNVYEIEHTNKILYNKRNRIY